MSDEQFWSLIALLDWEQVEDKDIIQTLVFRLSEKSEEEWEAFGIHLSERMNALDTEAHAKAVYGEEQYISADDFRSVKACVIANGEEFYQEVLNNPSAIPNDLYFDGLLQVPPEVYAMKYGKADQAPPMPLQIVKGIYG